MNGMKTRGGLQDDVEQAVQRTKPRVLFLNRSYWPDGEATGQLLTELTEDLAEDFEVTAVVGLPHANPSGERYRWFRDQRRRGVRILRVPHARLPKHSLFFRAINFLSFLFAAVGRGLFARRQNMIVVETDPFLLALVGGVLRRRHRAKLVIYLQDIHPDLGIAIGRLKNNWLARSLRWALRRAYLRADCLVVPSDDMRATLVDGGLPSSRCVTIPNWIDTRLVRPVGEPNGFRIREGIEPSRFVVMYSGNLGATQQLEYLLDAAGRLREHAEILFAFVGAGSAEKELRARADDLGLTNVRFFPYQPKERLGESLSAADLQVISVHPRALAYLMPSKLYGILAVGRPVLAAIQSESELARLILSENVGTVVPPNDVNAIVAAIEQASKGRDRLAEQGRRARLLAEQEYDRSVATDRFAKLVDGLMNHRMKNPSGVVA